MRGPALVPWGYGSGTHLVPNTAYLEWTGVAGATGYNIYRSDLGLLTPTPLAPTQRMNYTHRALLGDGQFTYSIIALYPNGCGLASTTLQSVVNTPYLSLSAGGGAGQVAIAWTVSSDDYATGAVIQGPGLPNGGADVKASPPRSPTGRSIGTTLVNGVPPGQHTYTATVYWDAPGGQFKGMPVSSTVTVP